MPSDSSGCLGSERTIRTASWYETPLNGDRGLKIQTEHGHALHARAADDIDQGIHKIPQTLTSLLAEVPGQ